MTLITYKRGENLGFNNFYEDVRRIGGEELDSLIEEREAFDRYYPPNPHIDLAYIVSRRRDRQAVQADLELSEIVFQTDFLERASIKQVFNNLKIADAAAKVLVQGILSLNEVSLGELDLEQKRSILSYLVAQQFLSNGQFAEEIRRAQNSPVPPVVMLTPAADSVIEQVTEPEDASADYHRIWQESSRKELIAGQWQTALKSQAITTDNPQLMNERIVYGGQLTISDLEAANINHSLGCKLTGNNRAGANFEVEVESADSIINGQQQTDGQFTEAEVDVIRRTIRTNAHVPQRTILTPDTGGFIPTSRIVLERVYLPGPEHQFVDVASRISMSSAQGHAPEEIASSLAEIIVAYSEYSQ